MRNTLKAVEKIWVMKNNTLPVGEDDVTFICRYESVSRNQQYMHPESDTYLQAEIWLILNESKYLQAVNKKPDDNN